MVRALHGDLLDQQFLHDSLSSWLLELAIRLYQQHQKKDSRVATQISNWFPPLLGKSSDEVLGYPFSLEDARLTIAREMGWKQWEEVAEQGDAPFSTEFESAVDALINGDDIQLKQLLGAHPQLTTQRSQLGHGATLLHYAGSNGVETWRQVVPYNLPDLVELILQHGADKRATASFYGGQFTPLALAETSAHPEDAGIREELLNALK